MEEQTINRPALFPAGTKVSLYHAAAVTDPDVRPATAPLESLVIGEVAEPKEAGEYDPAVTAFKVKLPEKGTYYIGAEVGGKWRGLRVTSGVLGSSNAPPARFPTHSSH